MRLLRAVVGAVSLGYVGSMRVQKSGELDNEGNASITPPWTCQSPLTFSDDMLKNMDVKGMAMDDTTMSGCADKILGLWPHTKSTGVKYLRLFAAWKSQWHGGDRKMHEQWDSLVKLCHEHNVKIFIGVDSDRDKREIYRQFDWALALMKKLGKDHVIGFSFGNEMLNKKLGRWWWRWFLQWCKKKVKVLDEAGFSDVPITVVWSMGVFPEVKYKKNYYINSMYKTYKDRWVWAVNPYAMWDMGLRPHNRHECKAKTENAVSMDYVQGVMTNFRKVVTKYTGNPKSKIWIGETGWSSPCPNSLRFMERTCPDFCAPWALKANYKNFLAWDGKLKDGLEPPEYIFFFTNRDAADHGDHQPFGIVKDCASVKCKLLE